MRIRLQAAVFQKHSARGETGGFALLPAFRVSAGFVAPLLMLLIQPGFAMDDQTIRYRFDMTEQALSQALRDYGQIAGQEIIFTEDLVAGIRSHLPQGEYTAAAALSELLKGTGLIAEPSPSGALMIKRAIASKQIEVAAPVRVMRLAQAETAQAASSAESSSRGSSDAGALSEVVVTAQKRSENLQKVPITVTAISGDTIQERNLPSAIDLAKEVPNVTVKSAYGGSVPNIYIRGLGISDYTGSSAGAVGVAIDEIFLDSPVGQLFQLYDLDRVEVLKGPQGTLFGRNTTAGLLSVVTRRPGFTADPSISIGYGRFDEVNLDVSSSIPLIADKLSSRVSVAVRQREGYRRDLSSGRNLNDQDLAAGRLQLLYVPNDRLEVLAKYEKGRNRALGMSYESLGTIDPATGGLCSIARIHARGECRDTFGYIDSRDPHTGDASLEDAREHVDTDGARLGIEYDFGGVALTSISAWNLATKEQSMDIDGSPSRALEIPYFEARTRQWTQELRLSSETDHPFQWILGAYYLHNNDDFAQSFDFFANLNPNPTQPFLDALGSTTGGIPVLNVVGLYTQEVDSKALFAHTTYQFTERLKATLGGRFTWEDKDVVQSTRFAPVAPTPSFTLPDSFCCLVGDVDSIDPLTGLPTEPNRASSSFQEPLWHLAVDYDFGNSLLYGSYSRGVRGSAFNLTALFNPNEFNLVPPEKLDNFEVGFKSDVTSALRLNVAAFYYKGDLQVFTLKSLSPGSPPVRIIDPAGIEGYGLDVDLLAKPLDHFTIGLGLGYVDNQYKDYPNEPGSNGNQLADVPKFSTSGFAQYEVPLGTDWALSLNVDANYRSRIYFTPQNQKLLAQDGYALVNGRIALRKQMADSELEVALWGRNLSDETYLETSYDLTLYTGSLQSQYGMPRTYGISLRYRL